MKKAPHDHDTFFIDDVSIETRTVYIGDEGGEIGPKQAASVVKAFHILNAQPDKPILVYLNTCGGCQFNGFAIYDTIKASPCEVTIVVVGAAMSMGAIILQAGDTRLIYPSATVMLHDGCVEADETVQTVINWADFSKKNLKLMYQILSNRTGKPAAFWRKKCATDFILTAQEALSLKLVDGVI